MTLAICFVFEMVALTKRQEAEVEVAELKTEILLGRGEDGQDSE